MRPKDQQRLSLFAFLAILIGIAMIAAGTAGCAVPTTPTVTNQPVDLATVAPCAQEDGPLSDGPVPCVWDAAVRGCNDAAVVASSPTHQAVCPSAGPYGVRWTLYATDLCPVPTVQADVQCVSRWDWSGGTSGTRP